MKKIIKNLALVVAVVSLAFVSCSDDDGPIDKETFTTLETVSYDPEAIEAGVGEAFTGSAITMTPDGSGATFSITEATKDGEAFTNPEKGFKVDSLGKVYGEADNELAVGVYELTITAEDRGDEANKKTTIFKVRIQ
jgi:hypothetical protein